MEHLFQFRSVYKIQYNYLKEVFDKLSLKITDFKLNIPNINISLNDFKQINIDPYGFVTLDFYYNQKQNVLNCLLSFEGFAIDLYFSVEFEEFMMFANALLKPYGLLSIIKTEYKISLVDYESLRAQIFNQESTSPTYSSRAASFIHVDSPTPFYTMYCGENHICIFSDIRMNRINLTDQNIQMFSIISQNERDFIVNFVNQTIAECRLKLIFGD